MSAVVTAVGGLLMLAVLVDLMLSLVHPDREGPMAAGIQRAVWFGLQRSPGDRPRRAQRVALAGPLMMVATFGTWLGIFIVGYALTVWPYLGDHVIRAP